MMENSGFERSEVSDASSELRALQYFEIGIARFRLLHAASLSVAITAILFSAAPAHAFIIPANSAIGATFSDGALHIVPPNILAHDPIVVQSTTQIGAVVTANSQLQLLANGLIDVKENTIGLGVGIFAETSSVVSVAPGGQVNIVEADIDEAIGIAADDSANINFAGSMSVTEGGNGAAYVAKTIDSAVLIFSGTGSLMEEGNHNAVGFQAAGTSYVKFTGSITLTETGLGDALAVDVADNAYVDWQGNIVVNESSGSVRVGAFVQGHGSVNFTRGSFDILTNGHTSEAPVAFLELADQSFVQISGGSFRVFEDGLAIQPRIFVTGGSTLQLAGSGFNFPIGTIVATTGEITGRLQDGKTFSWAFTRNPSATIRLVPEPSCLKLAIFALLVFGTRFTRVER